MKKKKYLIPILIILCILLILAAASISRQVYRRNTYISINGIVYPRASTELDLSGTPEPELDRIRELTGLKKLNLRDTGISTGDYEALQAALPECEILWSVPFQGGYLPHDVTEITLSTLSAEDISQLAYLPQLQTVHADECGDYDQLLALRGAYPQLEVSYFVPIQGQNLSMDTAELTLTDADAQELARMLPYLPEMQTVTLEGTLPEAAALQQLTAAFPGIRFYWQIELFGQTADVDTVELDFTRIPMDSVDEVESAVAYLPSLEKVIMSYCGISNQEMEALNNRHEDVLFVWNVLIADLSFRTDMTVFMPSQYAIKLDDSNSYNLRYCTEIICMDLGHHNVSRCDFVAYMPKLKYLILADTSVRDLSPLENCKELIYLELFLSRVTDYTPLLNCTALEDLNISYTHGDIEIISQMTWLKNLWWSFGPEQEPYRLARRQEILSAALPNTYIELDTQSSTGEGWRKLPNYYAQRDLLGMPYFLY